MKAAERDWNPTRIDSRVLVDMKTRDCFFMSSDDFMECRIPRRLLKAVVINPLSLLDNDDKKIVRKAEGRVNIIQDQSGNNPTI